MLHKKRTCSFTGAWPLHLPAALHPGTPLLYCHSALTHAGALCQPTLAHPYIKPTSSTASCRISLRFFSPPEKPWLTLRLRKVGSIFNSSSCGHERNNSKEHAGSEGWRQQCVEGYVSMGQLRWGGLGAS